MEETCAFAFVVVFRKCVHFKGKQPVNCAYFTCGNLYVFADGPLAPS